MLINEFFGNSKNANTFKTYTRCMYMAGKNSVVLVQNHFRTYRPVIAHHFVVHFLCLSKPDKILLHT